MSSITGYFIPESINIENDIWENGIANSFNNVSIQGGVHEGGSVHSSSGSRETFTTAAEPNVMYAVIKMNGGANGSILIKEITSVSRSYDFNFMAKNGNHVYFSSSGYNIASGIKEGGKYNVYCASRGGSKVHFHVNGEEMASTVSAARGNYNSAIYFNYGLKPLM